MHKGIIDLRGGTKDNSNKKRINERRIIYIMEQSKVGFIKFNDVLCKDFGLKVGEGLVFGALVSFRNMSISNNMTDEQGEVYAYPPISSIANKTEQSERSIKSHIKVLEEKGLMIVKRSYKSGSKEKDVNRYYLNGDVLEVYFPSTDATATPKAKPLVKAKSDVKEASKTTKQKIDNADVERWFIKYQGEINKTSATRLNYATVKHGSEVVLKAMHMAMDGVIIDSLSKGSTGLILSRLNEKSLEEAKYQIKREKDNIERFMNEPVIVMDDYHSYWKERANNRKSNPITKSENIQLLYGGLL